MSFPNSTSVPLAEARLREEIKACVTATLAESEDPENKLRVTQLSSDRSESQIDWLTQQLHELQEVVNTRKMFF